MALKRGQLKGMGLNEEQIEAIMEGHADTVDALKDEITKLKADAAKLPDVQKQLDDLKAAQSTGDGYEKKYTDLKAEFDAYKADVTAKESAGKIRAAYKSLLTAQGIPEKYHDKILKAEDLSALKLGEDGNITTADAVKEAIDKDWGDFKTSSMETGASVPTPPVGGGAAGVKKMTRDEIMAIKDTAERQKAINENPEAFGYIKNE